MNASDRPYSVRTGGHPVHIVRLGKFGGVYPNGVSMPSEMLCGAQVSIPRQYGPDTGDCGTVLLKEWCPKCFTAYRADGFAAEPGPQRSYTR